MMNQDNRNLFSLPEGQNTQVPSYKELLNLPWINKLSFPGDNKIYEFDMNDFEHRGDINDRVTKFYHNPSKKELAIKYVNIPQSKFLNPETKFLMAKLSTEIHIHKKLSAISCDHILKFYGACIHEGIMLICMELMDMSLKDFYQKIHEQHNNFSEDLVGYVAVVVVKTVCGLLGFDALHRDIKPDNILVNKSGEVKLCDFGESYIPGLSFVQTGVGTFIYSPPELLENGNNYDERSDVWSLGITLAELIRGKWPYFDEQEPTTILDDIEHQILLKEKMKSTDVKTILSLCFNSRPYKHAESFLILCLNDINLRPSFSRLQSEDFYSLYVRADSLNRSRDEVRSNLARLSSQLIKSITYDYCYDYSFTEDTGRSKSSFPSYAYK